jgi:glycosyltransferase involved in cell wall biosynthesis
VVDCFKRDTKFIFKSMKILQITNRFYPAVGGVETHVLNLSKQLVSRGHSVSVYCSDYVSINSLKKFGHDQIAGSINNIIFRRFFSLRFFKQDTMTFLPLLPFVLIKNIKNFDIIHVHSYGYFVGWMPIFIAKLFKKEIIYTPHYAKETVQLPIVKKAYDFLLGGWSFRWATRIIALTNIEKEEFINKFRVEPNRITVIPNGINVSESQVFEINTKEIFNKYGINPNRKTIINIGRIAANKGQIFLLEAFSKMNDFNLVIIGKDWGEQKNLEAFISLHAVSNVHILNNICDHEKNILLSLSDVFVLPSIGGEAFGIVLLEAMVNGIPVVASDIGGVRDLIDNGKNGFLVQPRNYESLILKINIVFSEFFKTETREYCINFAKKFDWKIITEKIEKVYLSFLH